MRVLRYVGPGEDERHLLVETIEGEERFSLHVTDELRQAASIDLPRLGNAARTESPITPREIQMRVRAGESPQEIAEQADMSLQRVMRFASAVVQERERIAGEARNARARRNTPDGEFVVFGEHVDSRFSAHGIEPSSVLWDSYRNEDGQWVISAGWHGGDLKRVARWTFTLTNRSITPVDETAADLLSDRPIRPVVHVVYDLPIANPSDSPTGPIPVSGLREQLYDQASPSPGPAANGATSGGILGTFAPAAPSGVLDSSPPGAHTALPEHSANASVLPLHGVPEPIPPLVPGMPGAEESDDDHAARARIPSWDDILMGVRRKRD